MYKFEKTLKSLKKVIDNNKNTIMTKEARIIFVSKVKRIIAKLNRNKFYSFSVDGLQHLSELKLKIKDYNEYEALLGGIVSRKVNPVKLELVENHFENNFDDFVDTHINNLIKKYNSSLYLNDETIPLLQREINKAISIGFKEMASSPNNIDIDGYTNNKFNYNTLFSIEEKREASLNLKSMISQKYLVYIKYLSYKYKVEKMQYIVDNMEELIKEAQSDYKQAKYAVSINHKDKELFYFNMIESSYNLFSLNFIILKLEHRKMINKYNLISLTELTTTKEVILEEKNLISNMINDKKGLIEYMNSTYKKYEEIDIYDFYTNLTVEKLNTYYFEKENIKERVFTTKESLINTAIEGNDMEQLIASMFESDDSIYADPLQNANITDNTIRKLLNFKEISNFYNTLEEYKEWDKSFYVYKKQESLNKKDTVVNVTWGDDMTILDIEIFDKATDVEIKTIEEEVKLKKIEGFDTNINEDEIFSEWNKETKLNDLQFKANIKQNKIYEAMAIEDKKREDFKNTGLADTGLKLEEIFINLSLSNNFFKEYREITKTQKNMGKIYEKVYYEAEKAFDNLTFIHDYTIGEIINNNNIQKVELDNPDNILDNMLEALKLDRIKHIEEELVDNKIFLSELEKNSDKSNYDLIEKLQHNIVYLEDIKFRLDNNKNIEYSEIISLFSVVDEDFKEKYINKISKNTNAYSSYEHLASGAVYTLMNNFEEKIYLRYLIVRSKKLKLELRMTKEYFEDIYGKNDR